MNHETKTLLDEVKGLIAAEREANNERLEGVESVGTELPELRSKVDKTGEALNSALDKLNQVARSTESLRADTDNHAQRIDSIAVGGSNDNTSVSAEQLRHNATVFYAGKMRAEHEVVVTDEQVKAYQDYSKAYARMLRRGDSMEQNYKAAMSVGSDPDGGYWVPTEESARILEKLYETSPMRQLCSTVSITGDSIEYFNDTNDGTSGGWVGEYESRAETATPQVGKTTIYVREQYAMPKTTQKILDMATINVESWLMNKVSDKMSRTENTAFVSGTGVDQPRGFLDYKTGSVTTDDSTRAWGVLQYTATGSSGGIPTVSGSTASDPDTIITMMSKLNPAYRAGSVFLMNRATEAVIRKLKDSDGRYLIDFGNLSAGAYGFSLFGFPITTAEDMPDIAADSYSVAFGNFKQAYQIVDGRGLRVLRDPYTTKGMVKFYTTKWTGGDLVNSDCLKLLKFGTS